MKKLFPILVLVLIFVITVSFTKFEKENDELIRIHIRANSNDEIDQKIKMIVKDEIVDFIAKHSKNVISKADMELFFINNMLDMQKIANSVLFENGFNYSTKIRLDKEEFPTRVYNDIILENGIYTALIVELGSGNGDNWWCIAFPPLCFIGEDLGSDDIIYKSKIKELIEKYKLRK